MNYSDYIELLSRCLLSHPECIQGDQQLVRDLEMNSLSVLLFLVRLEDDYGIYLPTDEFGSYISATVDELWKLIESHKGCNKL